MKVSKVLLLVISIYISSSLGQDVLVFLPGLSKKEIDTEIGAALNVKIKPYTSIKKLQKAIKNKKHDGVIAPGAFVEQIDGYSVRYQGMKNGSGGEKYFIVSTNPSIVSAALPKKKIGVWNVFGRKNIKDVVFKYFGIKIKKIKRVNKNEDLLTLLGIDMVDAILISQGDLERLKKVTDLNLTIISESTSPVPFPVAASRDGSPSTIFNGIQSIQKKLLSKLYFNKWGVK